MQQGMINKRADGKSSKQSRGIKQYIDNSAASIIVCSALVGEEGRILHANDETEVLFGFMRKELLNKNVAMLMPPIIGSIHN